MFDLKEDILKAEKEVNKRKVYNEEVFTKQLFNNNVKALNEEDYDNMISFFKCPFRKDSTGKYFKPCYERNCMAFRADEKTFWCAAIEAYGRTPINSKHPIEMFHNGDDKW